MKSFGVWKSKSKAQQNTSSSTYSNLPKSTTTMDQYWHKGGICGIVSRAALRTLQFVFAIAIMGIYIPDLMSSSSSHTTANSAWIYAEVAACLSLLTCITHCFVTVTRVAWTVWDWVLCVLWMAQFGVFADIYLKAPTAEDLMATSSVERMKAGVWVGMINMILWLVTAVLGVAWCCRARRFTRKEEKKGNKSVAQAEVVDGSEDQREMVDRDVEKGFSDQSSASSFFEPEKSKAKGDEALDLKRYETEGKPPSYRSA